MELGAETVGAVVVLERVRVVEGEGRVPCETGHPSKVESSGQTCHFY